MLSIRERDYVAAARVIGMRPLEIAFREILPNALPPVLALSSVIVAGAVLIEAALSFLGLSDPNIVTWGSMIAEGRNVLRSAPFLSIVPGIALMVTVLGVYLFSEGLADALATAEGAGMSRCLRSLSRPVGRLPGRRTQRDAALDAVDLRHRRRRAPRDHRRERLGQEHAGAGARRAAAGQRDAQRPDRLAGVWPCRRCPAATIGFVFQDAGRQPQSGADASASRSPRWRSAISASAGAKPTAALANCSTACASRSRTPRSAPIRTSSPAASASASPSPRRSPRSPKLLIADEPTSALDMVVQAEIVALLDELVREDGMTLALHHARHRAGVGLCRPHRRVQQGAGWSRSGPTADVLAHPKDAYTTALIASHIDLATPPLIAEAAE